MLIRVATVTDVEDYRVKVRPASTSVTVSGCNQACFHRSIMTAGPRSLMCGVTAICLTCILLAGVSAQDTPWSPPQV